MAEEKPVLDIGEVARLLTVSRRTVWGWAAANQFPKPMSLGRLRRWRREDIDAWLAAKAAEAKGGRP